MSKYIVMDERKDGCGDSFTTICDTPEQANKEALNQWEHLTRSEKAKRHIYAGALPEDSGYINAESDNCDIDGFDGAFDSAEYWFINDDVNPDTIYGDQMPVCISTSEKLRLERAFDCNLSEVMHVASRWEKAEYGVYDD